MLSDQCVLLSTVWEVFRIMWFFWIHSAKSLSSFLYPPPLFQVSSVQSEENRFQHRALRVRVRVRVSTAGGGPGSTATEATKLQSGDQEMRVLLQ